MNAKSSWKIRKQDKINSHITFLLVSSATQVIKHMVFCNYKHCTIHHLVANGAFEATQWRPDRTEISLTSRNKVMSTRHGITAREKRSFRVVGVINLYKKLVVYSGTHNVNKYLGSWFVFVREYKSVKCCFPCILLKWNPFLLTWRIIVAQMLYGNCNYMLNMSHVRFVLVIGS